MDRLKDRKAVARIIQRIARLEIGLLGDTKSVGGGVSELRVDEGPGYRIYFIQRREMMIVLLCAGSKKSQQRDIRQAQATAQELGDFI